MESDSDRIEAAENQPLLAEIPPREVRARAWPLLRRMIKASKPYRNVLALALFCAVVFASARYVRAFLAKPLLDEILVPGATMDGELAISLFAPKLIVLGAIAALTLLVTPIVMTGKLYLVQWVVAQVRRDLDQAVARKFLHISLQHHRKGSSGDLLARAMTDVQLACQALEHAYRDILQNLLFGVIGGVSMFVVSWPLALLTLTTVPPLLLIINYFGRRIHRHTQRRQETQGDLSQRLVGILSGIKVIKAFRGYALEEAAFARETDRYFKRSLKVVWNRVMAKSSTEALTQTVGFLVLAVGAWLTLNRLWGLTLGTLTAFAVILMTTYKPIKAMTAAYARVMESLAGASRLFELLDSEEELPDRKGARPMQDISHSIRFKDVHFGYGDEPILRGIDLDVRPGEVIAIVGKTGAGKSTLLDLLLRFHDPTSGAIEIDGVDLRDLQRNSFLDHLAVVAQEPFLFDVSILENIRYSRGEATLEDVRAAASAAQAHDFIEQLPEGYDTPVGEFGLRLSGGQRQRITIARAILRNPSILVFDEATSALDTKTERAIQQTIKTLRGEHTIFLVSHRLSTIRDADRIIVLDDGRVAEIGTHDTLMSHAGIYREQMGLQDATSAA
ncbi:MAG: ABC transporter ATP-binding protein [Myxococcota bacterium]